MHALLETLNQKSHLAAIGIKTVAIAIASYRVID